MARPTTPIILSPNQEEYLQAIARSRQIPYSLVQRAEIVLQAAEGVPNKMISLNIGLCEDTVGLWRRRWVVGSEALDKLENQPKLLAAGINELLADKARSGCPATFTAEQICRIIALACETPPETMSHWTRSALAQEAINRQIVDSISASSIGCFLKSGESQAAS